MLGAVGRVVAHKCASLPDPFHHLCLASRTIDKCEDIAANLDRPIDVAEVNADDPKQVADLIRSFHSDLVINVALPYQDLAIMDGCLNAGSDYLDTANYEHPDEARFSYEFQWPYHERFEKAGLTALLGSGFDPGVTNVFCAYAQKHLFDKIEYIDILDCNAADHGLPFATNFNPEINIREITANGRYWERGEWKETDPLAVHRTYTFPEDIGSHEIYLLFHEEMESLVHHIQGLKRIRFWMAFSENYLTHLRVLENVGMTRIDPIEFQGHQIVPLKFLKTLLPDPASLGPRTKGKTCIGCLFEGIKDGKSRKCMIYNICDHQKCFQEVKSQAVSYTTGVPAMIGAKMILEGAWKRSGVWNMEQFDPDPFMENLTKYGLPWVILDL